MLNVGEPEIAIRSGRYRLRIPSKSKRVFGYRAARRYFSDLIVYMLGKPEIAIWTGHNWKRLTDGIGDHERIYRDGAINRNLADLSRERSRGDGEP